MATDQERLLLLLEAQTRNFERALKQAQSVADLEAGKIERRFQRMNQKVQRDFSNFAGQVRTALAAIGVGIVVREATQLADVWTTVGNRIKFAGVAAGQVEQVQHAIADIASATRSDLDATADLFSRMFRSSEDLGASMERVLRVTEIVSKALAGASETERQGAIRQLGQGLGSGRLQGDELRSILENSRPIAEAIAREFDTTVGNLRELGKQGVLESRRVFEAIERAGADIDEAFSRTTFTVAASFTRLRTEAARFVGTNEQTAGSVRGLTRLIDAVADNFELLADAVIVTATVIGGAFAGTAVARAVTALGSMTMAMTTATTRAAALQTALAVFGGPLGIALTVAGGAMAYLATQTDVFASKAQLLQRAEDSLYSALQVITNLEVASEGAADGAGRVADEANRAARELDEMTGSADGASGAARDLEEATNDLAVVERERALATIEGAIADREALIAHEQRAIAARRLANALGAVTDPELQDERVRLNREAIQRSEEDIRRAQERVASLERVRQRLESGQLRVAASAEDEDGAGRGGPAGATSRRQSIADLERDADIRLARLRHEEARVRELEDAEEVDKRTTVYNEAGLALADARALAEAEVLREREAVNAEALRSYEIARLQDEIDLARIANEGALVDRLSDELEIRARTREIVQQLAISEEEAAERAAKFVARRREAIELERQRELELRALDDEAEAARLRGDAAAERAAERRLELEERIDELRRLGLSADAAKARAEAEIAALEEADFQGQFRRWFTGGMTAALEGDLDDFFEDWIRERAAAGLESALNEVADILFDSLRGVLSQVIRSGQDGVGQAFAAVFAGGATAGINQLGTDAVKAGEALGAVLAASAADAATKLTLSGAASAASAAKEAASAVAKTRADGVLIASSTLLAKSMLSAAAAAQAFAAAGAARGAGNLLGQAISAAVGAFGGGGGNPRFAGFRAGGGPMAPGFAYMVGERGRELVVPNVPSYVVPNHALGGRVEYVDRRTFNFQGTSEEFAQFRQFVLEMESAREVQIMAVAESGLKRRQWGRR